MEKKREKNSASKKLFLVLFDITIAITLTLSVALGFKYLFEQGYSQYDTVEALNEMNLILDNKISRDDFEPRNGELIFKIKSDGIFDWIPIIEGESLVNLNKGAGHITSTGYPGDGNRQIFIAAHRHTHFVNLGNIKKGDIINVQTPYGNFDYEVSHTKIVPETQVEVIETGIIDREELVLMTCYPFARWSTADDRFLVYAYPVEE